jgi:hypothetical protein
LIGGVALAAALALVALFPVWSYALLVAAAVAASMALLSQRVASD